MKVFFDDKNDFNLDLDELVKKQGRFQYPLIVVPSERDAKRAAEKYEKSGVSFIDYDKWLSKEWVVAPYDHIDFFRADQFFMDRCFRVPAGVMTIRRTMVRKDKEEN